MRINKPTEGSESGGRVNQRVDADISVLRFPCKNEAFV